LLGGLLHRARIFYETILMKNRELIFVAFGSLGDINPLLAVARKMKVDHNITFLANEYFKDYIEQSGILFHQLGSIDEQLLAKESKQSTGETDAGKISRFENIIGSNFSRAYDYIDGKISDGKNLVVISHGNLSPAVPACEKLGVPMIITHYAPSHIPHNDEEIILGRVFSGKNEFLTRYITLPFQKFFARFNFDIKPIYNEHRKRFGLPPIQNDLEYLWDRLTFKKNDAKYRLNVPLEIALLPEWFCEPIDIKLKGIKFAGFPFYISECQTENQIVDNFIKTYGKPIVFTPGTAVEDVDAFCSQIIPICRKLGSPGIFASKHGKAGFDLLEQVDDVPLLYLEQADLHDLLPKSRCLIHHGGIGTMAQAIKAGIPQIIRPRMYDQPANAIRVMMYGLGGSVAPASYDADTVARILLHIEQNPKHCEYLQYYSNLVLHEDGVANCCAHIEEYLKREFCNDDASASNSQLQ
jgi:rhamnosyltransferase subunit B